MIRSLWRVRFEDDNAALQARMLNDTTNPTIAYWRRVFRAAKPPRSFNTEAKEDDRHLFRELLQRSRESDDRMAEDVDKLEQIGDNAFVEYWWKVFNPSSGGASRGSRTITVAAQVSMLLVTAACAVVSQL
jgi:hypothetical protein